MQLSQRQDAHDYGRVDPIWCNATTTADYDNGDLWIYWLVISNISSNGTSQQLAAAAWLLFSTACVGKATTGAMRACGNYICLRQERSNGGVWILGLIMTWFIIHFEAINHQAASSGRSLLLQYGLLQAAHPSWVVELAVVCMHASWLCDPGPPNPRGQLGPVYQLLLAAACCPACCRFVLLLLLLHVCRLPCRCNVQTGPYHFTRNMCWKLLRVRKCVMTLVGYTMGHQASGIMRTTAVVL